MKNPKRPSYNQKKIIASYQENLNPDDYLVVKNLPKHLEVVKRCNFEKSGSKARTKIIRY